MKQRKDALTVVILRSEIVNVNIGNQPHVELRLETVV